MRKLLALLAAFALAASPSLVAAQAVQYRASDNINNTPVSAATPLPVTTSSTGTAGTPSSSVESVQGVTGGTPVVVVGSKLNDGTVTATGGAHLTIGGVNPSGNYLPASVTALGAFYTADMGALDAAVRSASVSSGTTGDTFDTTGYGSVTFQVVANASANTVIFEGSNDGGTTWTGVTTRNVTLSASSTLQGSTGVASTTGVFVPQVIMPKMRWRVSTFIGGTTTIAVGLKRSSSPNVMDVNVGNATTAPFSAAGATGATGFNGARLKSAATTNATSIKVSSGRVFGWALYNTTASAKYVKIYNKASAPTVGTDTPVLTIQIPANGSVTFSNDIGVGLTTGIAYAITGAVADSDTTAVAVDDVTGVIYWV